MIAYYLMIILAGEAGAMCFGDSNKWCMSTTPGPATASSDPLDASYLPSYDTTQVPANVWVTDISTKVKQDNGTQGTVKVATPSASRNEWAAFQVHVKAPGAGLTALNYSMTNLTDAQSGFVISSGTPQATNDMIVYVTSYVYTSTPTALGSGYDGGYNWFPDPLIPLVDPYYHQRTNYLPVNVDANKIQSFWVSIHVPTAAPSGYYSGTIDLSTGGDRIARIPVVLEVWDWLMPSTATLPSYLGAGYAALCYQQYQGSPTNLGCQAYNSVCTSDDDCAGVAQHDLGVFFLDHRMTQAAIYPPMINGDMESYWTKYAHLLSSATASGLISPILPGAQMTMVEQSVSGTPGYGATSAGTWVSQFQNNNMWTTFRPFDYTKDEPAGQAQWSQFNSSATLMLAASPKMPTLVTGKMADALSFGSTSLTTIMVAEIGDLTGNEGEYTGWLAAQSSATLGAYNSCESAGTDGNCTPGYIGNGSGLPNRHIDGTAISNRSMAWAVRKSSASLDLYSTSTYCWLGTDCGITTKKPWDTGGVYYAGGQGDQNLVYPGTTERVGVSTPIYVSSMRVELLLAQFQDYEYMKAMEYAGQAGAMWTAMASWYTNATTYNANGSIPTGGFTGTINSARQTMGKTLHAIKWPGSAGGTW